LVPKTIMPSLSNCVVKKPVALPQGPVASVAPRVVLYFGCAPAERADVETRLARAKVQVSWVESSGQAVSELTRRDVPVVLDLAFGMAALQVARDIRTQQPSATLFAVMDPNRFELTTEAVLAGVADVFGRQPAPQRIVKALDREVSQRSGETPAGDVDIISIDDLYCQAPAMRDALALMTRAAATGAGVTIVGEDGSGRQAVARAIHGSDSTGRSGRFVAVDCGLASLAGLGADLFGAGVEDEGATRSPERVGQTGRLFDARGGTLYLKNIAEAPARVQARLARLFRDREAVLVETGVTIPFDVRPIIGADAGLDGAVEEGRVRDDLFRRASAIRISLPPLRSRTEDIPSIANRFLRQACAMHGVPPKMVARAALTLIAALPWRGNLDELRNLIAVVVATGKGNRIALEDVLMHVRLDGGAMTFSGNGTLRQARARFERDYISAMLRHHRGRITEAAKALGIQRPNLYRKIRSLNVSRTSRRSGAA
jgi:DNA-binding NtrC family response regulator